jgi:methionyl-tRNA formyltransferase
MRIVFVGTVEFSRHCLKEVLEDGGNVVAVLTLPKEKGRFHSDYADLSDVAAKYGIPVYKLRKKITDSENVELIRSMKPDVIFVFGWSQLLSKEVLDIPPLGCIGTHPALLPRNRGRHPLIWALVEGLEESGLTFFYIDEGTDSGNILWQKPFPITLEDDAQSLYEKIKSLASKAIREFLPQLEQGTAPRIPQDDSQATHWRKRSEKDGEIDWSCPTITTYNLIRALARPYVGAHTHLGDQKVRIWKTKLPQDSLPVEKQGLEPGTVFASEDGEFNVGTGDGYLTILECELPRGEQIEAGARLGGHS